MELWIALDDLGLTKLVRCIWNMSKTAQTSQPPLWPRVRQATGTVYGDIGTSVLYTIMEITREAVLLRNDHLGHAAAASLVAGGGNLLSEKEHFWLLMESSLLRSVCSGLSNRLASLTQFL